MPWEFMFVMMTIFVAFILPFILYSAWSEHNKRKFRLAERKPAMDNSLTTSELENMITQAVTRAIAPLETRMDALEDRLDEMPALSVGDAYVDEDDELEERRSKTVGRISS